jgi:Tol biopolymer transport system component
MPYNGERMTVLRSLTWDQHIGIVGVFSGDAVLIPTSGGGGAGAFAGSESLWVAGPALVHQEYSQDRKTRWIKVTTPDGESRTLWKDYDPKWISLANGPRTVASPDGKWIAFISDRTGWAHLYVLPADAKSESDARQLSKGNFGDGFATWSPDSKRIAFAHSADGNQMERFISIADVETGKITPVVTARGVNFDPSFSPDGSMLVYTRSAVEHPLEVYAAPARAGGTPVRLTNSLPAGLDPKDLTAPVAVSYPSRATDQSRCPRR